MDPKTAPHDCFPCKFGKAQFEYDKEHRMMVHCTFLDKDLPERHDEKDGPCPHWQASPAILYL